MREDADERTSILSGNPFFDADDDPHFSPPRPLSLDPAASKWLDVVMMDHGAVNRSANTARQAASEAAAADEGTKQPSSDTGSARTNDQGSVLSYTV